MQYDEQGNVTIKDMTDSEEELNNLKNCLVAETKLLECHKRGVESSTNVITSLCEDIEDLEYQLNKVR